MTSGISKEQLDDFAVVRRQVNDFLLDYCRHEIGRADELHPNYKRLWQAINAHVEGGGKRIRPYLVVMSYGAFGGDNHAAIIRAAAAWELIHIAMLMHDDIIDRDYTRHGEPNVAGHFLKHYKQIADDTNRHHYANSSALLAGDLLISAAYELLFTSDFSPPQVLGACKLLHEAIFTVVGGELLDVEASAIDAKISPEVIAEAKTASYSLIGPLLTGASLASASPECTPLLRQLGLTLGIGFQYVDDVLGVFGDESKTGKSTLSDLEEGKRTFVVVEALKLMNSSDRKEAERLLSAPSATNAAKLRALILQTDAQAVIDRKIDDFYAEALRIISELELPAAERSNFEGLAFMVLRRQA